MCNQSWLAKVLIAIDKVGEIVYTFEVLVDCTILN